MQLKLRPELSFAAENGDKGFIFRNHVSESNQFSSMKFSFHREMMNKTSTHVTWNKVRQTQLNMKIN